MEFFLRGGEKLSKGIFTIGKSVRRENETVAVGGVHRGVQFFGDFCFFLKVYFKKCVRVCTCMHAPEYRCPQRPEVSDHLEMELLVMLSCLSG